MIKEECCIICGRDIEDERFIIMNGKCMCSNCMAMISRQEKVLRGGGAVIGGTSEQLEKGLADYLSGISEVEDNNAGEIDYERYTPKYIYDELSRYVVGQHEAKVKLAVAAHEHMMRISGLCDIDKSNVLMVGSTGSGKTYLIENLARILNVPFVVADATSFTEAGYAGADIDNIIKSLYAKAGGNRELAERGIVFIDEFDKLCKSGPVTSSGVAGVGTKGVQQELLKMVESAEVGVGPKNFSVEKKISTKNILFICGGAFVGLEECIERRLHPVRSMGFGANVEKTGVRPVLTQAAVEDLVAYGVIPEMAGRLPVLAKLEDLDQVMLVKIFSEPVNCLLHQYEKRFLCDGIELVLENEVIDYIASEALKLKVGSRGLKNVAEGLFSEFLFKAPGSGASRLTFAFENGVPVGHLEYAAYA